MRRELFVVGLWLLVPAVLAQEKPATAPPAVQTCTACHGPEGQGVEPFPRLAGLGEVYIKRQLDAFANGERVNAIMKPIASGLSAEQRQEVARYFSELPVQPDQDSGTTNAATTGAETDGATDDPGKTLALHGQWQNDLPACVQCHGPGGRGIGDNFPPLAGQPAAYLEDQLKAWRAGSRAAGPLGLMGHIAEQLDENDLKAVAEYFASQPAIKETNNE